MQDRAFPEEGRMIACGRISFPHVETGFNSWGSDNPQALSPPIRISSRRETWFRSVIPAV